MGLNIVAYRRVSLAGFGEGWNDCHLTVKAFNPAQVEEARNIVYGDMGDDEKESAAKKLANDMIVGGVVINTKADGTTEPVKIEASDVPYVVDMLGAGWLQQAMLVAAGADRLKAT